MLDGLRRFAGDAARGVTRAPLMSVTIVGTLAFGVGSVVMTFALLDLVLSGRLPAIGNAEELVFVENVTRGSGSTPVHSYPNYEDLRDAAEEIVGLAAYRVAPVNAYWNATGERAWGYLTSNNYFDVLQVAPVLGRTYTDAAAGRAGNIPVMVISHRLWQRRFGRDPAVIGESIRLNSHQFLIVGVAPADFIGTELLFAPDFWVPLSTQPEIEARDTWLENRRVLNLFVMGRLREGRSFEEAEALLRAAGSTLAEEWPGANRGYGVGLSEPGLLGQAVRGPAIGVVGVLLVASILVLIAVGVNVASLVVAQALERIDETRIRVAIGATPIQLVRHVLGEQVAVAIGSGACGCLMAWMAGRALAAWNPGVGLPLEFPSIFHGSAVVWAAACGFGIAAAVILCCGLLPVLWVARPAMARTHRSSGQRRGAAGRYCVLLVQVAATVALLSVGAVVRDGVLRAVETNLGFRTDDVVSLSFDLGLDGYGPSDGIRIQREVVEAIRGATGVSGVAVAHALPLSMDANRGNVELEGRVFDGRPMALVYSVSPQYFQVMNTRVQAGRGFAEADGRDATPVALVNDAFVRRFTDGDAMELMGRRMRVGGGEWREIVGVVETGKYVSLSERPAAVVFLPVAQGYRAATTLVIRSRLPATQALSVARGMVERIGPRVTVYDEVSLVQRLGLVTFPGRVTAGVLGGFGAMSLVLTLIGTFALVANGVARRREEAGIRRALGAGPLDIVRIMMQGLSRVVLVGAAAGVIGAYAMVEMVAALLFGEEAGRYGVVLVASCGGVVAMCLAVGIIPMYRFLNVEPAGLLRE